MFWGNRKEAELAESLKDNAITSNVQEPVLAFVEFVKNNPKKFKITLKKPPEQYIDAVYTLHDNINNKKYDFCVQYPLYPRTKTRICTAISWLTQEECVFIYDELIKVFSDARAERRNNILRERMKRIYCR